MEKVLFLAIIIIIAGSSNGLPAVRPAGPHGPDPHAGHDHKHGHHHDGIAEVVMEHLGNILWSLILKNFYLNVPPIIYAQIISRSFL